MRIGIMTYWQTLDNYGQVLQCYALQRILKEMGHEPFVIRYDLSKRPDKVSFVRRIGRKLLYPIYRRRHKGRCEARLCRMVLEEKRRCFEAFRKRHFTFSENVYGSLKELKRNAPKADCYIAGSDQIWGQLLSNRENEAFFLAFGSEETRRISFAVSYGMEVYPAELRDRLGKNLRRFARISCRERDGVAICESVGVRAERVIDPTLVCRPSVYEGLTKRNEHGEPYLFLYSVNVRSSDEVRFAELQELARSKEWRTLVTVGSGYFEGREIYDGVEYSYATIGQWLDNIRSASLVVTTSFHGVVFCILFHRPFVYVPLQGSHSKSNNRVYDLLVDVGLREHVLESGERYERLASIKFNWGGGR